MEEQQTLSETNNLDRALAAIDRHDLHAAEETLRALLLRTPADPQALQLMGVVRGMQGRMTEAEDQYRRSLAVLPNQPHVHHNLGKVLRSQGRFAEAVTEQRVAVSLKPNYAEAHLDLAIALSDAGDHDAALKSCRDALRIQPNFLLAKQTMAAELCAVDRPAEAERLMRAALALGVRNPRQKAALEHNLAIALKQQRHYAHALSLFDSARQAVPEMPFVDYNRASTLQQIGRMAEAVDSYRVALVRNPLDLAAHRDLNELLYRLGDDDGFLRSYDEASLLYPDVGELPLHKGNFLYLKGEFESARECFERAKAFLPDSVTPHDGLALALARLDRFGPAIAEHRRVVEMEPENSHGWRNYAQTLLAAGNAKTALMAAERAVAIEPDSQIALAVWGLALRVTGDPREIGMNDTDNLVRVYEVGVPDGYTSMEAFNRDLNLYLDRLHLDRRECIDQTLRTGTQTLDNLFGAGHDLVERLRARIDDAIADYVSRMGADETHPLYRRRKDKFGYAASWSSRLHDCGFHTNHVHPKGWISSAYYVSIPESAENEERKEGWIKFGEPNLPFGIEHSVRRTIRPEPGLLVLFPSYMWHGTIPFHSAQSRTTIAFDAVPA